MQNYILRNESGVYYECGFSCDSEIFIKLASESYFITDGRYTLEAKEAIKNSEVIEAKKSLIDEAIKLLKNSGIKKITIDPKEWSLFEFEKLSSKLDLEFKRVENFSQKKRIIKDSSEIKNIKEAVKLGAEAFDRYGSYLKETVGKSEKYLFFEAVDKLSNHGELKLSFDPIIALDENSAKPHAHPTNKSLQKESFILLDAGVKYNRYCSDRTRCSHFSDLHFGKEQSFRDKKAQKIYDIVLKAQEAAIKMIKPGVKAKDIDKAAREVIDKAGYAKQFVHSTGHGVGLDIHEEPFINKKNPLIIKEDMIFTIEPGIYLEGEFGVRIEDMIRVTGDGAEIL